MGKLTLWLSTYSYIIMTTFSVSSLANIENSVTLKLSFDKYSIPHTTFIINGNPVYAMVDTGSTFGFHLHESQLKKIKGLKNERRYRSIDGKGKIQDNIEYLATYLDVNGIKLRNVPITPFKQWGLMISGEGELPESPVVGLGAFKDKLIVLDYAENSLMIADNIDYSSLINNGFKEYYFQMSSDGMVFNIEQSGYKYHLILDTGATISMIWQERLKSYTSSSCLLVDPEMDNPGCEATMLTIKSLNGESDNFGAVVVDGDFQHMGNIDGLVGNNFIKNRKIIIDFKNKKVFISDAQRK